MATPFTNVATLNYNGGQIQSNIAVGMIEGILHVTKYAVNETYAAGDTLTYVVSIVNNSDEAINGLTVSDDLGAYAFETSTVQPLTYVAQSLQYYLDGVLQPDPAVAMTDGIVLSGISVPANGNTTLIYSATVNAFAPLETGAAITNTVTVESQSVSAVTAEESVAVTNAAELSIVKSVTPIPVPENGELTYTFQLLNAGNTAVLDTENATVTDTFNPVLSGISVMLDGTALTEGVDYTYDEATGEFATANGVIAIPAATFTQDQTTGEWSAAPGSVTLTVTGRISAA